MSSIPKAKKSVISDLSVFPDEWDAYPEVERSEIHECIYRNLSSATHISRSQLTQVTIEGTSNGNNEIQRSNLRNSSILNSRIERTTLDSCSVSGARLENCKLGHCTITSPNILEHINARLTKFVSSSRIERSELDDSVVMGKSSLERSVFKNSVIADSTYCERSELDNVVITRSRTERSKMKDCDVMDCEISRTDFEGMILKYGIWKNGDLVGRTSKDHEVVIKPRHTTTSPSLAAEQLTALPVSGWKAAEAVCPEHDFSIGNQADLIWGT